ncbi:hypothetical protein Hanom_Chr07g00626851 [Helianthus anomalus]
MLAYYMVGSDKLFSDVEVPIQNMIAGKIDKVFWWKLRKLKLRNLLERARKLSITNQVTKRKTQRLIWVIKRNKIKRKGLTRQIFRKR